MKSNLRHLIEEKERDGDGVDVVTETQLDDVSDAQYNWMARGNVRLFDAVVCYQVKHNMDLRQIGMFCQVEISWP